MNREIVNLKKGKVVVKMADEKGAKSNFFADASPHAPCFPPPPPFFVSISGYDMYEPNRTRKCMHRQSMKQGREDRSKLESRASKCRSGPEQTNYRAVQNMQFRASQGRDNYTNWTMQEHWCRWGQSAPIEAITRVLEESG